MQKQERTLLTTSGLFYVDKNSFIKLPCSACGAFTSASTSVCSIDQCPLVQTSPHFDNGSMLFPLTSVLGEGGMGTVYKAIHPGLGKQVAIKVIHDTDPLSIKRFQLEAKALSRLNHKNLISVFDFGVSSAGSPFMIMEFVDGHTLSHHIQIPPSLTLNQIIRIFRDLASGIGQVHNLGLIHRDLKPDNIILAADMSGNLCPKLIDFGIAKSTIEAPENSHLTMTGTIVGSPIYMSPEQCCGENLDHLTDIYSFGCMLFESISGQPPFKGKHFIETITLHATAEPPPIAPKYGYDVSPELSDLIYSCLEKSPEDRPQSMEEIVAALTNLDTSIQPTQQHLRPFYPRTSSSRNNQLTSEDDDDAQEESEPSGKPFKPLILTAFATIVTLALGFCLIVMSSKMASSRTSRASLPALNSAPSAANLPSTKTEPITVLDEESMQKVSHKLLESRIQQKQLDISKRYSVDDDVLKALTKAKDIELLNLADDAVGDQSTKYYSHLPLKALCLRSTEISDTGLKEISKIKTLTAFDLTSTAVTNTGLSYLSAIPNLKELHLRKCILLTDHAAKPLSKIKSLELLDVSKTKLGDSFLAFVPNSSSLTVLDIADTAITDGGFKHLENSQIKDLDASNLQITPACLSSIKRMRSLRKLNLYGCYQISSKDVAALEASNPACRISRATR